LSAKGRSKKHREKLCLYVEPEIGSKNQIRLSLRVLKALFAKNYILTACGFCKKKALSALSVPLHSLLLMMGLRRQ
jgi:hypothetical protein